MAYAASPGRLSPWQHLWRYYRPSQEMGRATIKEGCSHSLWTSQLLLALDQPFAGHMLISSASPRRLVGQGIPFSLKLFLSVNDSRLSIQQVREIRESAISKTVTSEAASFKTAKKTFKLVRKGREGFTVNSCINY